MFNIDYTSVFIKEILTKSEKLMALEMEFQNANTGDVGKWVEMGLMTPDEYDAYRTSGAIHQDAQRLGIKAENAVKYEIDLPAAYKEVFDDFNEVDTEKKVLEAARNALGNVYNSYRGSHILQPLLSASAKAAAEEMYTQLSNRLAELYPVVEKLERAMKAKERRGSLVKAVREEASRGFRDAQHEAREKAVDDYLAPFQAEVKAGKAAESAMNKRIEERRTTIASQINQLLEGA